MQGCQALPSPCSGARLRVCRAAHIADARGRLAEVSWFGDISAKCGIAAPAVAVVVAHKVPPAGFAARAQCAWRSSSSSSAGAVPKVVVAEAATARAQVWLLGSRQWARV